MNIEWNYYYKFACDFYRERHHLNIPTSYKVMDGNYEIKLGSWLHNQKKAYKRGELAEDKVKALEEIGVFWSAKEEKEKVFPIILKKYYEEHGDINMTEDSVYAYNRRIYPLGRWIHLLKKEYREGLLDSETKKMLEKYNIIWDTNEYSWKKLYSLACKYYEQKGDLLIPRSYSVTEGNKTYHVGKWVSTQRYKYKLNLLDQSRINMLESIGMLWTVKGEKLDWFDAFSYAKEYYEVNGHLNVPANYQVEGFNLGYWVISQKRAFYGNHLDYHKKELLESIGIVWYIRQNNWMMMFEALKVYKASFKSLKDMEAVLPEKEYQKMNNWMRSQRMAYRAGKLDEEKIKLLESIGFIFDVNDLKWQNKYAIAKKYYEENHHLNVPKHYVVMLDDELFYLASWLHHQRCLYNVHELSKDKIELLNSVGIVWNMEDLWDKNYSLAKEYYIKHGDLQIKYDYVVKAMHGEIKLGKWIYTQRLYYNEGILAPNRIEKLEQIGMLWSCRNKELREICQEYGIDYDKCGRSIRCNTKTLLLVKIAYMQNNNIPFVTASGRINRIFCMSATNFSLKYNVDIEEMAKRIDLKGVQKCL